MRRALIIAILLLLTIIGGVSLLRVWANAPDPGAKVSKTKAEIKTISQAATLFEMNFGRWPKDLAELTVNEKNIVYIERGDFERDAWGHKFVFEAADSKHGYCRILSFGRDGKPGGSSYDADLELRFSKDPNQDAQQAMDANLPFATQPPH
jgi:general secretion pathway protein G